MRRKKATPRFYVIMAMLLVLAFVLLRPLLFPGTRESVISMANADRSNVVDCVIIRSEPVTLSDSTARVEYVAPENSLVEAGQTIANIYTTGYSESLLDNLESTRKKIQEYHKQLLANIVDSELIRMDAVVDATAEEFKNLITHRTIGNLQLMTAQLTTAMVNRQEYLRQNKREDNKLTKLYEEENTRLTNIQSWRKVSAADRAGVVSFYIDGYENDLTAEGINALTIADVRSVLAGGQMTNTRTTAKNGIYRIVDQDHWYVAALVEGDAWQPIQGQEDYYVQLEGFSDLTFRARVYSVQKESGVTLAVFEIEDPMGPLIYQRCGKARFSITLTGLSVSVQALYSENGQTGVWLYDVPGGTFVPVEVLSIEGDMAIIQPLRENTLQRGQIVLIK